ncbi:hypothetical protein LJC31_07255 [Synergistaceae bacterium OttesenSCG-928-I11]|nr:hypothetical protein [Synergistaceae bacterium OttesenSCG-928-I11]
MNYFLLQRFFGLFWALIQQICFVWLKRTHDNLAFEKKNHGVFYLTQCAIFLFLSLLCFARDLGFDPAVGAASTSWRSLYPWQGTITVCCVVVCAAMVYFDAMLVVYAHRLHRIYRGGVAAARKTLPVDVAVFALVFGFAGLYLVGSEHAVAALDIPVIGYIRIRRFFIQISNLSYVILEVSAACIFYRLYREMQKRAEVTERA